MNTVRIFFHRHHLAEDIIRRFSCREAVGKEEIERLLQMVMSLRDETDATAQKAFCLVMEIDVHYRDPFDRPIENVAGLAAGLSELEALIRRPSNT